MIDPNEQHLLKIAKARVYYKKQLVIAILANIVIWLLYIITVQIYGSFYHPWPVYVSLIWAVFIIYLYMKAYKWDHDDVNIELQKLKKEREHQKEQQTN